MRSLVLIYLFFFSGLFAQTGRFIYSDSPQQSEIKCYAQLSDCELAITNSKLIFKYPNNRIVEMTFENSNQFQHNENKESTTTFKVLKGNPLKVSNFKTSENLTIPNIYSGIDLILHLKNKVLEYEFLVDEKANAEDISIKFNGIDKVEIFENDLLLSLGKDKIYHKNLAAFQKNSNNNIKCEFAINYNNSIQFNTSINHDIRIDPVIYSTFLGGSGYDFGMGLVKNKSNEIYITGYTNSIDFPYTEDAFRREFKENPTGESDAFVSKLSADGKLMYSTFFGSFTEDKAVSIALDTNENIVITGYTKKTDTYPFTTGCIDSTHNGGYDLFIAKFDSTLTDLLFSTLIGSTRDDYSSNILIDKDNNYIVCGNTSQVKDSIPFPITAELQPQLLGEIDLFLLKLNERGDSLIYSTLFGGSEAEFAQDMQFFDNDNVWIAGSTRSKNFPVSPTAFKQTNTDNLLDSTSSDGFYSMINLPNNKIVHSGYLGGAKRDVPYAITLDTNKNLYICGFTESSDFYVSNNAYDKLYENAIDVKGKGDAFVTKISAVNYGIDFSTFIGGTGTDRAFDICTDTIGNSFVTGYTFSKNFPITKKAFRKSYLDTTQSDGFLLKLSNDGSTLLYSSYLGGNNFDICKSMICDSSNYFFITGGTASGDFPVTPDAQDTSINDTLKSDLYFTKFKLTKEDFGTEDYLFGCANSQLVLSSIYTKSSNTFGLPPYTYLWNPSTDLNFDDVANPICTSPISTSYTFEMTDALGEKFYDTIPVNIVNTQKPEITGFNIVMSGYSEVYTTKLYPGFKYEWFASGGAVTSGQGTNVATITFFNSISGAVYCSLYNDFGCADTSLPIFIFILPNNDPKVQIARGSLRKCESDTLILDCGPGFTNVEWSDGKTGRTNFAFKSGKYWFKATNLANKIVYSDTVTVLSTVSPAKPIIRYTDGMLRCLSANVAYQWYYNYVKIPNAKERQQPKIGNGVYYCDVINGSCSTRSDLLIVNDTINSVDNYEEDFEILVYPNPSDGIFNFVFNGKVSLFNSIGTQIEVNIKESNIKSIDLSAYPKGVYTLKLEHQGEIQFKRIILN